MRTKCKRRKIRASIFFGRIVAHQIATVQTCADCESSRRLQPINVVFFLERTFNPILLAKYFVWVQVRKQAQIDQWHRKILRQENSRTKRRGIYLHCASLSLSLFISVLLFTWPFHSFDISLELI